MKYDIRLICNNLSCGIITTNHLPIIGEKINTLFLSQRIPDFENITRFKVVDITHFYNDDFSEIDYSEIKLEKY